MRRPWRLAVYLVLAAFPFLYAGTLLRTLPQSWAGARHTRTAPTAAMANPPAALPETTAPRADTPPEPQGERAAPRPTTPMPRPAAQADMQASGAVSDLSVLKRGRTLARALYGQQLDVLWSAFRASARADWQDDLAAFRTYRARGVQAYGAETTVLKEEVVRSDGLTYYLRTSAFERGPHSGWTLIFGLDEAGMVREFGIVSASALPKEFVSSRP